MEPLHSLIGQWRSVIGQGPGVAPASQLRV